MLTPEGSPASSSPSPLGQAASVESGPWLPAACIPWACPRRLSPGQSGRSLAGAPWAKLEGMGATGRQHPAPGHSSLSLK